MGKEIREQNLPSFLDPVVRYLDVPVMLLAPSTTQFFGQEKATAAHLQYRNTVATKLPILTCIDYPMYFSFTSFRYFHIDKDGFNS